MANDRYTGVVPLDLQKMFDTAYHVILYDKLEAMGIGSNWLKSYLSEKTQRVKVGDTIIDSVPITYGVPQGSILGLFLFLCCVNDMAPALKCKLLLYTDDSVLLVSDKNLKVISDTLSRNLDT